MPLSGSTLAYKPARFGLMCFGASRFNYFIYNVLIRINGSNATNDVIIGTLSITQALNDEPDTARFRLGPSPSVTPTAGQTVTIGLGSYNNYEFAGQIVRVTKGFEKGPHGTQLDFTDVECIDYGRL